MDRYTSTERQAHCDKHNIDFTETTNFMDGKLMHVSKCEQCQTENQKIADEKKEKEEVDKLARFIPIYIQDSIDNIGIPKRYEHATLENYITSNEGMVKAKKTCVAYLSKFEQCYSNGTSLVFCGNVGTGKTHLAMATAKAIVQQYQNILAPLVRPFVGSVHDSIAGYHKGAPLAHISNALDILRDVKSTYSKTSEHSERDVIDFYVNHPLLIIDEVGIQYGTDADKIIIFDILNRRYQEVKPTILISNLPLPELKAFIGERVVDRMREANGAVIDFSWDSYRGEK